MGYPMLYLVFVYRVNHILLYLYHLKLLVLNINVVHIFSMLELHFCFYIQLHYQLICKLFVEFMIMTNFLIQIAFILIT